MTELKLIFSLLLFSVWLSSVIIAGGFNYGIDAQRTVEILSEAPRVKQLPNLSSYDFAFSTMILHNKTILLYGGIDNARKCFQLKSGTWIYHSTFNEARIASAAVATEKGTFVFGGGKSPNTYEYLPKDSTMWQKGKVPIPDGFKNGCAIAVNSGQEIWLIGGRETERRILSFYVNWHAFEISSLKLNVERESGHNCAFIPNTNKIIVAGGTGDDRFSKMNRLESSVVIDTEKRRLVMARRMNTKRMDHGIGTITFNGEERLAVFGGRNDEDGHLDSVEVFNAQTNQWERTDIKLKEGKTGFGYLTVLMKDIISDS